MEKIKNFEFTTEELRVKIDDTHDQLKRFTDKHDITTWAILGSIVSAMAVLFEEMEHDQELIYADPDHGFTIVLLPAINEGKITLQIEHLLSTGNTFVKDRSNLRGIDE